MHDSKATPLLDERIASLAARQDNLFSLAQFRDSGGTRSQASDRTKSGRWRRIHPGVYSLGHAPLSWRQRVRAALLAAGPDAVASHTTAAALYHLRRSGQVHITCATRRRLRGVVCHQSRAIERAETQGFPVTTIERTLLDLAASGDAHLARAIHEADFHRLLDLPTLNAQMSRGHAGARRLREALRDYQPDAADTDDGAATELARLISEHGLPRPQTKRRVAGHEADFYWPAHNLVVEVDGRNAHLNHHAFERDRRRDADMVAAGVRVVRLTGRRIRREPDGVVALLSRLTS
jgi:very-short-patch-repair endonuclease